MDWVCVDINPRHTEIQMYCFDISCFNMKNYANFVHFISLLYLEKFIRSTEKQLTL